MKTNKCRFLGTLWAWIMILTAFSAILALMSCPVETEELTGMWENILIEEPPLTAYEYIFINEDETYTSYFCIWNGSEYSFLLNNESSTGTYERDENELIVSMEKREYYEGEWQEILDPPEELLVVFELSGDNLTFYVDLNQDDDYDDERETINYERAEPVDVNGDGDTFD